MSRTEYARSGIRLWLAWRSRRRTFCRRCLGRRVRQYRIRLSVSPTFVEQYVEAARLIAKKAVGDISLENAVYPIGPNTGREAMLSDFGTQPSGQAQLHG
jgi:hypothetical protein